MLKRDISFLQKICYMKWRGIVILKVYRNNILHMFSATETSYCVYSL
jgi:hypothetical protein